MRLLLLLVVFHRFEGFCLCEQVYGIKFNHWLGTFTEEDSVLLRPDQGVLAQKTLLDLPAAWSSGIASACGAG
jgi:hypothetical protein